MAFVFEAEWKVGALAIGLTLANSGAKLLHLVIILAVSFAHFRFHPPDFPARHFISPPDDELFAPDSAIILCRSIVGIPTVEIITQEKQTLSVESLRK